MSEHPVIVDRRAGGQILRLILNAPKANVLDARMLGAIEAAVAQHGENPDLKVIVFEGAGAHFCFGASVTEHQADQAAEMLERFHALFARLGQIAVPTAAVVRGQCLGGGLELAAYCTWIFADTRARFGQPEIKLAVFPPLASVLLPWRTSGAAALDLCVSGRSIDAAEAQRIGLVQHVSSDPAAAFEEFFGEHLAPLSAPSMRFAERAVRLSLKAALDRDLGELERIYLEELMQTPDANEGIAAFLEKRPPRFGTFAHRREQ